MSSNLKTMAMTGWEGGLNLLIDETKCQPNQLRTATNVKLSPGGVVGCRPFLQRDPADITLANYVQSLWSKKTGFPVTVANANKEITNSLGVVKHTYATGGQGQFEFFNDTLLHTNGVDIMQQWDGVAAATSDVVGSPLSKVVLRHNDRIFAATGSVVYETAVQSAIDFANGAATNIGLNDGGPVYGLGSLAGDLYIFKESSIYRMTGYAKNERQILLHTNVFGSKSPNTIKNVKLEGFGEVLMFLDTKFRLCMMNVSGCWNIGEYIQPLLDTLGSLSTSHAEVSISQKQYLLGVAAPGPVNGAFVFCLHYDQPYKSAFGTRWGITKYINPFAPQAMCETPTGLILGIYDTVNFASRLYFISPEDGSGLCEDDMTSIDFRAVNHSIRTADLDMKNINQTKQWRRLNMMLSLKRDAGAGTVPLSLTQYNDRATTTQTWTQSPTAAATFFDPVVDSYYADLKDPSRQISIGIVSNALGQAFRLHGMDIFYKPGPVENRA